MTTLKVVQAVRMRDVLSVVESSLNLVVIFMSWWFKRIEITSSCKKKKKSKAKKKSTELSRQSS